MLRAGERDIVDLAIPNSRNAIGWAWGEATLRSRKEISDEKLTGVRPSNFKLMEPENGTLVLAADSTNRTVSAFAAAGPPVKVAGVPLATVIGPSGKVAFAGGL
jgi:hypothetical protein